MVSRSVLYIPVQDAERYMPSLVRFLFIIGVLVGVVTGGLVVLSDYFEPQQREIHTTVPGVKVRR